MLQTFYNAHDLLAEIVLHPLDGVHIHQVVCQQTPEEEAGHLAENEEARTRAITLRFIDSKVSFDLAQNISVDINQVVLKSLAISD